MTRPAAIAHVCRLLQLPTTRCEAVDLIELFHLQPEELTEAGATYEQLRALELQCLHYRI